MPAIGRALATGEGAAEPQLDTVRLQLPARPAHHRRRVGGEEVIVGRGERQLLERRRIQPHLADAPRHRRRQQVEELHSAASLTMMPVVRSFSPGSRLRSSTHYAQSALRRGERTGGARETGADDDDVGARSDRGGCA
jgi:hypothetical protein